MRYFFMNWFPITSTILDVRKSADDKKRKMDLIKLWRSPNPYITSHMGADIWP